MTGVQTCALPIYTLVRNVITNSYGEDEISYSDDIAESVFELKSFNTEEIYCNEKLKRKKEKLKSEFIFLFNKFFSDIKKSDANSLIYKEWIFNRGKNKGKKYLNDNSPEKIVIDFIASMTDRYFREACSEHKE